MRLKHHEKKMPNCLIHHFTMKMVNTKSETVKYYTWFEEKEEEE